MKKSEHKTASHIRHRLTLQQEERTPDGAGGYSRVWQDVAELWGEVLPAQGADKLVAGVLQAEQNYIVTLRYRAGVTVGMRLLLGERTLLIHRVTNVQEKNHWLELWAQEQKVL